MAPTVDSSNEWLKGQRCPGCNGRRGKVIARILITRETPYGEYKYWRYTHRVETAATKTIKNGRRKGYTYHVLKRKYCYIPLRENPLARLDNLDSLVERILGVDLIQIRERQLRP